MSTPSEVYPFATQDGKAIPLDILKPSSFVYFSFVSAAKTDIVIPQTSSVAIFLASETCLVSFEASLVGITAGVEYTKTLLVPKDVIVASVIQGLTAQVRGLTASGSLYVQLIEKWAGLSLEKQYGRK